MSERFIKAKRAGKAITACGLAMYDGQSLAIDGPCTIEFRRARGGRTQLVVLAPTSTNYVRSDAVKKNREGAFAREQLSAASVCS